ncbi:hypothetical protein CW740_10070 [Kangiella profundi]|uniref:Uncharacterized protein n=1 Tax=Kangiella profundi TaxID=1561924 RepID=A0A2K9ADQ1_9GAMM|nr:hypothetical protein [Kangiella profundi]AUD79567.1 hypothetical protein CW740_10070 [Kangiella profundi]GGE97348.1 hypothetical protein GCM10011356_08950 [Kangiella profundi]
MIFRILIILAVHLYSQVGHAYKDDNKTERTYKGFISATLNSDKSIHKQMFVREYFDKFNPTKDSFNFTGDKDPEVSFRLWFQVLDLSGELFNVNIILESKKRDSINGWNVVYDETVSGILYGKNKYDLATVDLPTLNIEIDIDKNFIAEELKERFNN